MGSDTLCKGDSLTLSLHFIVLCPVLSSFSHSLSPQLQLQWKTQKSAPGEIFRGAAVTHHNTVYCISRFSSTVYHYQLEKDEWQKHSQCPHSATGLAIISDVLTAVGGKEGPQTTNKLVSWRDGKWVEEFPSMHTPRFEHAVVSDGHYIIAAGGYNEASVELFTISSNMWSVVASLPRPLTLITATLCGHHIYAMDGEGQTYAISMSDLAIDTPTKLSSSQSRWLQVSRKTPITLPTLSTLSDEVVAVGGMRGAMPSSDIYQLSSGEWVRIGRMHIARLRPVVAVLPGDKMIVVGGYSSALSSYAAVELAVLCK